MSAPLLELKDFCVSYGEVQAVDHVNLRVMPGEIVTVIGPNGAGKTTLLSAAMGLLRSQGPLFIDGQSVARPSVESLVARGLALVPEKRELFGEMSVEDNLLLGGFSRWRQGQRDQAARMQEVFQIFPRLQERRAQMASTLSGGERPRRALARPRAETRPDHLRSRPGDPGDGGLDPDRRTERPRRSAPRRSCGRDGGRADHSVGRRPGSARRPAGGRDLSRRSCRRALRRRP